MKELNIFDRTLQYLDSEVSSVEPPILCLHGWGGSSAYWKKFYESFGSARRVICPNLPNINQLPRISGDSLEIYSEILEKFLDALEIKEFDLMGHSMGGLVSLLLYDRIPQKVRKLIIVNSPIEGGHVLSPLWQFSSLPICEYFLIAGTRIRPIRTILGKNLYDHNPVSEEILHGVGKVCSKTLLRDLHDLGKKNLFDAIGEVKVPLLFIGGDKDKIVQPKQYFRLQEKFPEHTHHIFSNTGHCPMEEEPEQFHKIVQEFLYAEY